MKLFYCKNCITVVSCLGYSFIFSLVGSVVAGNNLYDCSKGCELDPEQNGGIVCGIDAIDYLNACLAVCQGVTVAHDGRCNGSNRSPGRFESEATVLSGYVPMSVMTRFDGYKFVRKIDPSKLFPGPKGQSYNCNMPRKSSTSTTATTDLLRRSLRVTHDGYEYVSYGEETALQNTKFPKSVGPLIRTIDPNDITPKHGHNGRRMDIIETDNRSPITNTTIPPYATIGRLDYATGGVCTGTVIYENSTLTAAHCLFNGKEWLQHQTFAPARNGYVEVDPVAGKIQYYDPFGFWLANYATIPMDLVEDFVEDAWGMDYGVVTYFPNIFNNKTLGDVVGYVGIKQITSYDDESLLESSIIGYPDDKGVLGEEMWTMGVCPGGFSNGVDSDLPPSTATHKCDTIGTYGSPVLRLDEENGPFIRGIHVAGTPNYNIATMFVEGNGIYESILDWTGRLPACSRFCWFFQSPMKCCNRFRKNRNRCLCKLG